MHLDSRMFRYLYENTSQKYRVRKRNATFDLKIHWILVECFQALIISCFSEIKAPEQDKLVIMTSGKREVS